MVEWFFLAVSWVCLQLVIVVFPDHTHLLFFVPVNAFKQPPPGGVGSCLFKVVVMLLLIQLLLLPHCLCGFCILVHVLF